MTGARHFPIASLLLLTIAGLSMGGCVVEEEQPRPPNLFLMTIDTLRADHLGLYGYARATSPRIDDLFADGLVYERAYSTQAMTGPSIASILTGQLPQQHGVRLNVQLLPAEIETLADVLRRSGYTTAAFVSNVVLTDEAMGLAGRFDHYDDFIAEKEPFRDVFERSAAGTTEAALAWLLEHGNTEQPIFLWAHYIDPHGPYRPPEASFQHRGTRPIPEDLEIPAYVHEPGVDDALDYVDRYDGEILFVDQQVGRFLDALPELGYDNPYIVLTADHGESMMEHDAWFRHGHAVYEEVTHVPLMLRGPGIAASRVKTPVSIADVAPTLLDFAGASFTESVYGGVLTDPDADRPVYADGGRAPQNKAMWLGNHKWVARVTAGEPASIHELAYFDLARDPLETNPGDWPSGPATAAFRRFLGADPVPGGVPAELGALQGTLLRAPKVARRLDPATTERLRALGYIR